MRRLILPLVSSLTLSCAPPAAPADAGAPDEGVDAGPSPVDAGAPDAGPAALTWYRDVEPIAQRSCQGCHAEGGIGPFALDSYDVALERSEDIANAVADRAMPPWMPADECEELAGSRRLSEDEVATVVTWVEQGALEGELADHTEPTVRPGLARVDLTLEMSASYLPNDVARDDDYRCFALDPALEAPRYITGLDIQPGQRALVHHVLLFPADAAEVAALDAEDAAPGWPCFGGPRTSSPRTLGAWAPGTPPIDYPAGTGVKMNAGELVVMQVHYNFDTAPAAPDRTTVQLRLEESVASEANMFPAPNDDFSIPPGATSHSDELSLDLSLLPLVAPNARLHGLLPHMHTAGRSIRLTVEGAAPRCLIDIPEWDFHWQQAYFFAAPGGLALSGGQLVLECVWDNPTSETITWGEGTADEMCLMYLYVTGIPQAVLDNL